MILSELSVADLIYRLILIFSREHQYPTHGKIHLNFDHWLLELSNVTWRVWPPPDRVSLPSLQERCLRQVR